MENYGIMFEIAVLNMIEKIKNDEELYDWFMSYTPKISEGYMWSNHKNIDKLNR